MTIQRPFFATLFMLTLLPTWAAAQDPSHEFWLRFNDVYDIGRNFHDDTARGSGRIANNQGAYVYRYELPLPPGRAEMAPTLELLYSSHGQRSYLGEGWTLPIPHIERSTRFGIPSYTAQDLFDYHDERGAVHHLVPVAETPAEIRYRRMSESSFSWFKYDKQREIWTVLKKDGHRLEFGNPLSTASGDGKRGRFEWWLNEERDTSGNTVHYYYRKSSQNLVVLPESILYTGNIHKGIPGNEEFGWRPAVAVKFLYSRNPRAAIERCRTGHCRTLDEWTLDRIIISILEDGRKYRKRKQFLLDYEIIDYHRTLSTITPTATDVRGSGISLPAVSFRYGPLATHDGGFATDINYDDPEDTLCFPDIPERGGFVWTPGGSFQSNMTVKLYDNTFDSKVTATYTDTTMIDINGDGVMDRVRARHGGLDVYPGRLHRREEGSPYLTMYFATDPKQCEPEDPTQWRGCGYFWAIDADCDNDPKRDLACPVRTTKDRIRSTIIPSPAWSPFPDEHIYYDSAHVTQNLIDMNGDGRPDWIQKEGNLLRVAVNRGDGFHPSVTWNLPALAPFIDLRARKGATGDGTTTSLVALVDINGDSRPDIVSSAPWLDNGYLDVYFNTGKGFESEAHHWVSPFGTLNHSATFMWSRDEGWIAGIIELSDMNGDGLIDLVVQPGNGESIPPSKENLEGKGMGQIQVFLNVGDGFALTPRSWGLERPLSLTGVLWSRETRYRGYLGYALLLDVNGDGLPDYLQSSQSGLSWQLYENLGNTFAEKPRFILAGDLPGRHPFELIPFVGDPSANKFSSSWGKFLDINGDGRLDFVAAWPGTRPNLPDGCMPLKLGRYTPGIRLVEVANGYGQSIEVEYTPSSATDDPLLPTPLQVVRRLTRTDAFGLGSHRSEYRYRGGLYVTNSAGPLRPGDREFRGFEHAEEMDLASDSLWERQYSQNTYNHGDLVSEVHKRKSSNKEIRAREWHYAERQLDYDSKWGFPEVKFFFPEEVFERISNEEHPYTTTMIRKSFDNHGNLEYLYDFGVLGRQGVPEPDDDRMYRWDYKNSIDLESDVYIFATETMRGHSRKDEHWAMHHFTIYYHDDSSDRNHVTRGLVTRQRAFSDRRMFYDATRSYDDDSGLLLAETDLNGNPTSYTYDSATNTVIASETRGELTERFEAWDLAAGKVRRRRDINNVVWYYEYDGFGRAVEEGYQAPFKLSLSTRTIDYHDSEYRRQGKPAFYEETTLVDASESLSGRKVVYFNGAGRMSQQVERHDGSQNIVQNFGYDVSGRLQRVSTPRFTTAWDYVAPNWDSTHHTLVAYDPADRITSISRPCNRNKPRTFSFGGDLSITMTDEEKNRLTTIQDMWGNVLKVIQYEAGDDPVVSIFDYDGNDGIVRATDPLGKGIEYERDMLGRIRSASLIHDLKGGEWIFEHDGNENLIRSVSPAGRVVTQSYDEHDRLIKRELRRDAISDGILEYVYDGAVYGQGRLTSVKSPAGEAIYSYDPLGRVIEYRTVYGRATGHHRDYKLSFTPNDMGLLSSITYPDGYSFRYSYNSDGTGRALYRYDGKQIAEAVYDPWKQPVSISTRFRIGTNRDFDISYTRIADVCGRPVKIASRSVGQDIMQRTLSYSANDKLRTTRDLANANTPIRYDYDSTGRLTSANGETYSIRYEYDHANRLVRMDRDGQSYNFLYEDIRFPWALTALDIDDEPAFSYAYDEDGVLAERTMSSSIARFTFNARGLLATVATETGEKTWLYDHFDRRVTSDGALAPFGGGDFIDKYYENYYKYQGQRSRKYLFFAGRRLAVQAKEPTGGQSLYYFHSDELGSVRYVSDVEGKTIGAHYYYPFGEEILSTDEIGINVGFNDRQKEVLGFYNFPKRTFDPVAHQWLSFDSAILETPTILILDGVNPFAYVGNDPLNRVDPSGAGWWLDLAGYAADFIVGFGDEMIFWKDDFISKTYLKVMTEKGQHAYKPTGKMAYKLGRSGAAKIRRRIMRSALDKLGLPPGIELPRLRKEGRALNIDVEGEGGTPTIEGGNLTIEGGNLTIEGGALDIGDVEWEPSRQPNEEEESELPNEEEEEWQ